ncbi:MAG: guanylate kinase [Planctomycetota bacterium]|nr:MAG: guanylate kinase [Planctomycetota bacterium]
MTRGRMLVISGPSGSGKSTLVKRLLEDPRVVFSISCTTRAPRDGEVDGRDYQFLSRDEFRARVERNAFIEWAEVYGNLYGTPREPIERALAAGKVYLLEIDVQGALKLKSLGVDALYIFISPPDLETLRARLVGRGTDKPESIERRMSKARDEMTEASRYDHIVINRDIDLALAEVRRLVGLPGGPEVSRA